MQLHRPDSAPRDTEDHILPLINIVFLLLIFFMVAGALTTPQAVDVEPPEAAVEGEEPDRDEQTLYITAEGALSLGEKSVELEGLAEAVGEREEILLRADAAVEGVRVVEVMRALREAGLERVRLVTRKEGE
ncbi:biopolymer transport protein ExbD [Thiohalospira halophila DSM 15071]|uniref:Biopolymer transport protein ExbD n=1 Tax=Thiohalospira halophila DSM 15071 TaxID=1123397 RepID=A0A1I1V2L8_9GAMM|nr:biopolymer transporter ExbD [Thiohalospira halophila]SFD74550.1 biopolymer transport protein ExbD [Thiohalospira halophila DSM 15071]